MKKSTLILLITSIFYGYNACPQSKPRMENPDYAVTVFYDDFETGSNWRDKWIPGKNGAFISPNFGNILIWVDSTATINQSLGKLSLIARGYEGYTTTDWKGDPITADYISGSVKSKDRFLYGVFECNATFGYKHGSFPAFWLYFDSICGYDYGSEIDIVELKYEDPNPGLDTHAFYYPCGADPDDPIPEVEDSWSDNPFNWSALNPHTFKCIWTPTKTEWYVDNTLLNTIDETEVDYYPNKTMVMILCQQLWPYDEDLDNIEVPVASTFNWVRAKEFFLAPEITVPNLICSSGTAVLDVAPAADSVTWSLTPTNLFSGSTTGSGKTANITAAGPRGLGKITYTFKMPSVPTNEIFTAEKTFYIGDSGFTPIVEGESTVTCDNALFTEANRKSVYWSVYGPLEIIGQNFGYRCTIKGTGNGYGWVYATNDCGSQRGELFVEVDCGFFLTLTPNPSTGETTVAIESSSDEIVVDENEEWEMEVYSDFQLLKKKDSKLRGKYQKLQTTGWKEGVYIIRVKYKDMILQEKLLVK